MKRKRTSETDLVVSATSATPARRKPATRPRATRAAEPLAALAPAEQETVAPQVDAPVLVSVYDYIPTNEEIAKLAFSYWEARGCQGGSPEEDWLRAEDELRNRSISAAVA